MNGLVGGPLLVGGLGPGPPGPPLKSGPEKKKKKKKKKHDDKKKAMK